MSETRSRRSTQPETAKREGLVDEHIDPVAYKALLELKYRSSLKCWWGREFGWIALLDPFTGEVYEVDRAHPHTPRWMTWRAMDEKAKRRGTSSGSRWRGSSA